MIICEIQSLVSRGRTLLQINVALLPCCHILSEIFRLLCLVSGFKIAIIVSLLLFLFLTISQVTESEASKHLKTLGTLDQRLY